MSQQTTIERSAHRRITKKLRQKLKVEQDLKVTLSRKLVKIEAELEQYQIVCGLIMIEAFAAQEKGNNIRSLWVIKKLAQLFHKVSYFYW